MRSLSQESPGAISRRMHRCCAESEFLRWRLRRRTGSRAGGLALQPERATKTIATTSPRLRNLSIRAKKICDRSTEDRRGSYFRGFASRNIHQTRADGIDDQFGCLVNIERIHNVCTMNGDGIRTEIQGGGNFFIGLSVADQL